MTVVVTAVFMVTTVVAVMVTAIMMATVMVTAVMSTVMTSTVIITTTTTAVFVTFFGIALTLSSCTLLLWFNYSVTSCSDFASFIGSISIIISISIIFFLSYFSGFGGLFLASFLGFVDGLCVSLESPSDEDNQEGN